MESLFHDGAATYEQLDQVSTADLLDLRSDCSIDAVVTTANIILNQRQFHILMGIRHNMSKRRYKRAVKQLSRTGVWPRRIVGGMPNIQLQTPSYALR